MFADHFIILFSNNNNVHHYMQRFNLLQSVFPGVGGYGPHGIDSGLGVGHPSCQLLSSIVYHR